VLDRTTCEYPIETRRGADRYAFSLMLFLLMSSIALSLVPIVRDQLQDAPFSLSDSEIGLLASVFMLMFSVGALPAGVAAARWGGPTLLVGGVCLAAGSVLFALSSSYPWFLVGRFLQGAGGSAAVPVCNALIAHTISPSYRGRALGIVGCGHGLGVIAALLIMPSIQEAGGFRAVFLTTAGIALLFAAVAAAHREVRGRSHMGGSDSTFSGLLRTIKSVAGNRLLLLIFVVNIGVLAIFVGILTWTPAFLHDQRAASLAVAAYLTAGLGAAQVLGNAGGAMAMARWGKPAVIVGAMALMFLATILVPVVPGVGAVFVCVVVAGFLTMALYPAVLGSIIEIVPRLGQVGPATGYMSVVSLLGTMFAPWLFGALLDSYGTTEGRSGYLWGYLLLGLFALVGTAAAVAYMVLHRRDASATSASPGSAGLVGASGTAGTEAEDPGGSERTGS
jgi:MFS family permease